MHVDEPNDTVDLFTTDYIRLLAGQRVAKLDTFISRLVTMAMLQLRMQPATSWPKDLMGGQKTAGISVIHTGCTSKYEHPKTTFSVIGGNSIKKFSSCF